MHITKVLQQIRNGTFKRPTRCLLCGRTTEDVGIFFPHQPELFGGIKGKGRLVLYAACLICREALGQDEYNAQVQTLMMASPSLTNKWTVERN